MFKTIISTTDLAANLDNPNWVIVDASYELADKAAGYAMYQAGHIPGAVYAHPFDDLSGPPLTDQGRHPLPSPEKLISVFSRLGISKQTQVIAYDNRGITAARLWWLLNYMGHDLVAVLDGGIESWKRPRNVRRRRDLRICRFHRNSQPTNASGARRSHGSTAPG